MTWEDLHIGDFISLKVSVWKVVYKTDGIFHCTCMYSNNQFHIVGCTEWDEKENIHLYKKLSQKEINKIKAELL